MGKLLGIFERAEEKRKAKHKEEPKVGVKQKLAICHFCFNEFYAPAFGNNMRFCSRECKSRHRMVYSMVAYELFRAKHSKAKRQALNEFKKKDAVRRQQKQFKEENKRLKELQEKARDEELRALRQRLSRRGRKPTTCPHGINPKRNCDVCRKEYMKRYRGKENRS